MVSVFICKGFLCELIGGGWVVKTALGSIATEIIKLPRTPTETIVIQSSSTEEVPPLVLVPHGGPHGTMTTAFNPATTALVLEGCACICWFIHHRTNRLVDTLSLPNYTGSPGFGDEAINALLGQCGRRDVDDCIASVDHLIELGIAQDGPGKLFVMGGSHGGFLTAHRTLPTLDPLIVLKSILC